MVTVMPRPNAAQLPLPEGSCTHHWTYTGELAGRDRFKNALTVARCSRCGQERLEIMAFRVNPRGVPAADLRNPQIASYDPQAKQKNVGTSVGRAFNSGQFVRWT